LLDASDHIGTAIGPVHLFLVLDVQLFGEFAVFSPHLLGFALLQVQLLLEVVDFFLQLEVLLHQFLPLLVGLRLRDLRALDLLSQAPKLRRHIFVTVSLGGEESPIHILDELDFIAIFVRVS
jgi:hypothetical protein